MKQLKTTGQMMAILLGLYFITGCQKTSLEKQRPSASDELTSRKPDNPGFAANDMVLYWNQKAEIVATGPYTPPAQSRYFAMIEIAVHDALNSIKPKYQRYALKNEREQFASPDAAVASAAYWTIKKLGIQANHPVDNWYAESLQQLPDGESKELGKALGLKAAEAIISNRADDNFEQANLQLPQPDGIAPGEYRSTLPFSNPGMPKIKALHQWGKLMKPFVAESNSQFRPAAPYPVNSSEYLEDYNEVKTKGGRVGHTRTADEDQIGKFWVERSSIGWNRFARNIIQTKKLDAWKTARLFALMHAAMMDGVSGCFEAKYYYLYWRPETAIRLGDSDGNDNTTGDANWLPSYTEIPNPANPAMNVYTPPLPDYPSAHASFGGAAAEILKLFFESDQVDIDQTSNTTTGVVRHYSSISQAARDNSLSRIYVGFHFRNACLKGEEQGKKIATYIFNNSFREE